MISSKGKQRRSVPRRKTQPFVSSTAVRGIHNPRVQERLRLHRGPLRALFGCLEADSRQTKPRQTKYEESFFWELEVGITESWREDWACPHGWTTLRGQRIERDVLIERLTRWGSVGRSVSAGRKRAIRAVSCLDGSIDFIRFEECLVEWAGDELSNILTSIAAACCNWLKRSCLSKLELRAPWWLLGRGEASTTGLLGPEGSEVDAILLTSFQELRIFEKNEHSCWRLDDFYALCRDAGVFGEALSPAALLTAYEDSARERDPLKRFKLTIDNLAALWWRGEHGDRLGDASKAALSRKKKKQQQQQQEEALYTQESPSVYFLIEKILPLVACRGMLVIDKKKDRLQVDAESVAVIREHDMALRCLFVAYSDAEEARMPPLSLLHFARDFRLLAADRFAPSSIVDAAKLAQQPNHPDSDETRGLRWPEFVETLVRLAYKLTCIQEKPLASALTNLLTLMDPDGRVFFVGQDEADLSPKEKALTPPLVRRALAPSENNNSTTQEESKSTSSTPESTPQPSHNSQIDQAAAQRLQTRLDFTERSLSEAAEATRKLAEASPDKELQVIANAVAIAAAKQKKKMLPLPIKVRGPLNDLEAKDDTSSCFTEGKHTVSTTTIEMGTQVDLLFSGSSEWPPPPHLTPHEIWADAAVASPEPESFDRTEEAVLIQRSIRGFALRTRLARLRDRLLQAALLARKEQQVSHAKKNRPITTSQPKASLSPEVAAATRTAKERAEATIAKIKKQATDNKDHMKKNVYHRHTQRKELERNHTQYQNQPQDNKEDIIVQKPAPLKINNLNNRDKKIDKPGSPLQMSQDEERAVIHAFALAALLGDGSPSRVARARALVETLKDLPGGTTTTASASASVPSYTPRQKMGPTLDEIESKLRDAMARVALEETWSLADEGTEEARLAVLKLSAMVEAHPGYSARIAAAEAAWDERERPANRAALAALRELVPLNIAQSDKPSVAAHLAKAVGVDAKDARLEPLLERVWTQRILWLVHTKEEAIAKIHLADLRSRYTFADLDPIELRAIYACLPNDFEHDDQGDKHAWRMALRSKLRDALGDAGGPVAKLPNSGPINGNSYYTSGLTRRAISDPTAATNAKRYHYHNQRGTRIGHSAYDVLDHASQPVTNMTPQSKAAAPKKKDQPDPSDEDNHSNDSDKNSRNQEEEEEEHLEWRECWDDNYKRMYYFNDVSGDSRWEPPEDVGYIKFDEHFADDASVAPSEAPSLLDPSHTSPRTLPHTSPRTFGSAKGFRRASTNSLPSRSSLDGVLPHKNNAPLDAIHEKSDSSLPILEECDTLEDRPSFLVSPLSDEEEEEEENDHAGAGPSTPFPAGD